MTVALIRRAASNLGEAHASFLGDFEAAVIAALPEPAKPIVVDAIDRDADALTPTNHILIALLSHAKNARANVLHEEDTSSFLLVAWQIQEAVAEVLKLIVDGQANVVTLRLVE